jgi:hypothetical protein
MQRKLPDKLPIAGGTIARLQIETFGATAS